MEVTCTEIALHRFTLPKSTCRSAVAQRIQVQRVQLIRRHHAAQAFKEQMARRRIQAETPQHPVKRAALQRRGQRRLADCPPETQWLRAPSRPPRSNPSASTTAFIAPALVPLISAISSLSSSRSRSRTASRRHAIRRPEVPG